MSTKAHEGSDNMRKTYRCDPKSRKYLSIGALIVTAAVIALLAVLRNGPISRIDDASYLAEDIVAVIMLAAAAVYICFLFILPGWYRKNEFTVTDDKIIAVSGVIFRSTRIMRISAVQHVTGMSLPVMPGKRLRFVIVSALGGKIAAMFLSKKDQNELICLLEERINAAAKKKKPVREERYTGKYSDTDISAADYVYTDNASIFSTSEVNDIFDDFSGYSQLSFVERENDGREDAQLSFSDIEQDKGGRR